MVTKADLVNMIDDALEKKMFSAVAIGVGRDGDALFTYAAGQLSRPDGAPANLDTRYDMASVTKLLSPTMVALRTIESGKLCLFDELQDFFDFVPPDKAEITIKNLMTHTSGISPSFHLEDFPYSPADAARCILERPLEYPTGSDSRYSCMGYIVLGRILEKIYGKPLNVLSKELVFDPLGMTSTGYLPEGGNIAATEVSPKTGVAWQGIVHDENARFLGGVSANAGVFSNVHDCMRFAQMLANFGELDGVRILSRRTMEIATRSYTPDFDTNRGLGMHLGGGDYSYLGDMFPADSFGHTGFTGTSIAVDPHSGLHVTILTNRVHPSRDDGRQARFRRAFHNAAYTAFNS